jgi:hypothetical protein
MFPGILLFGWAESSSALPSTFRPPVGRETRVTGVPALAASMTGCQRHRLVVEEQPGEPSWRPLLAPPVPETQRADDPQITGVGAHDPTPLVQPSAVARERSRNGNAWMSPIGVTRS